MKNLGRHLIWLNRRLDGAIRVVFEKDGKLFIKFEHGIHEVRYDSKEDIYIAEI